MVLALNDLPSEVWLIVLQHVNSVAQLATCRLVCKAWDPLAERVLFSSQNFRFKDAGAITQMYHRLVEKPYLGHCISSMCFLVEMDRLPFHKHFLQLAFTPNIEIVQGMLSHNSLSTMIDIAKQSHTKYNKLRLLSSASSEGMPVYYEALLYFRDALQQLDLMIGDEIQQCIFDRLSEFNSLRKLTLNVHSLEDSPLTTLEKILVPCPHLQELELSMLTDFEQVDTMEMGELEAWIQTNNVQRSPNKCQLYLNLVLVPYVVDYLLYKYPNVTDVLLNYAPLVDDGKMDYRLNLVKQVDYVALHDCPLDDIETLETLARSMGSKRNHVFIEETEWSMENSVKRHLSRGFTEFEMSICGFYNPSFAEIVETVGHVVRLEVGSGVPLHDPANSNRLKSHLYELLAVLPDIEHMTLTEAHIQHQPALVNGLVLEALTDIHLCGAIIDTEVLPTLSMIAPHLERLTLDTCLLDAEYHQNQRIHMPQTHLDTLSILATGSAWDSSGSDDGARVGAGQWIQESISVKGYQLMFLSVARSSSSKPTLHFVLKPGTPSQCKQISPEDHQHNAVKWPKMLVTCRWLNHLKLRLGALAVDIDLNTDRMIEALDDWKMDKHTALALHLHNV